MADDFIFPVLCGKENSHILISEYFTRSLCTEAGHFAGVPVHQYRRTILFHSLLKRPAGQFTGVPVL